MRAALASLVLALPLPFRAAPAQDASPRAGQEPKVQEEAPPRPDDDAPPEVDIFGRAIASDRSDDRAGSGLQGCWQLVSIQLAGFPELGRQGSGLMLVHAGRLSFELHLSWPGEKLRTVDLHQSYIAEYELLPDQVLRVTTLSGAFLDDLTGRLEWERSGFERRYTIERQDKRQLVLTFGPGNRMSFVRREPVARAGQLDIFGREVREAGSGRDIFGRPTQGSDQRPGVPEPKEPKEAPPEGGDGAQPEVDIFGRPVTAEKRGDTGLDGCWQLIDIQLSEFPDRGRQGSGMMLVSDGRMSLELHLSWAGTQRRGFLDFHQSFTADYEALADRTLRVTTLIGAFLDDLTGRLEWERSGFERRYTVERQDKQQLVLTFGPGNRMSFLRREPIVRVGGRDIFGRETQGAGAARDVFGRPIEGSQERPK